MDARAAAAAAERRGASVAFAGFAAGAAAVRAIVQDGLRPANCRLIDAREAALTLAGDGARHCSCSASSRPARRWGSGTRARPRCCREHGGEVREARRGGGSWREAFLRAPYVRDTLVAMGVLSETFESAITWDRLDGFVEQVTAPPARRSGPPASSRSA